MHTKPILAAQVGNPLAESFALRSQAEMPDRFPPPWTVNGNANCYWVEAANGTRVAYVYFRNTESIGSQIELMSRDGARRIASNIAKLPQLIRGA